MDKSYYVLGSKVTVEELEDVIAVEREKRQETRAESEPEARGQAIPVRAWRETQIAGMADIDDDPQWKAFEAAGWTFERRSENPEAENLESVADEPQLVPEATRTARIFRHPTDGIQLGMDQMTVRLDAALREGECRKILADEGLEIIRRLRFAPNLYEVRVRSGIHFLDMSMRLHDHDSFVYAEPQFIEYIGTRFVPTDPFYDDQWQWKKINAEEAWDIERGAGVRLAVIDKGFDLAHGDLKDAITASSGFFDPVTGKLVQDHPTHPLAPHGTFCAGMAVARANNAGGCGIANQADLIAVSCLPDEVGTQATLARAVAYAANPQMEVPGANAADGADVISCSLGPKTTAAWEMKGVLKDAIDFAVNDGRGGLGTPVFWAVTNGNFEIRFDKVCSYRNVIAVGRSTATDNHGNCGFGPQLQFLAPGVDVVSTLARGTVTLDTGTSFAAPIAAGIAALVLASKPALKWKEVRKVMRDSCDQVTGGVAGVVYTNGRNDRFGFGRVNAAEAVRNA